MRVMGDCRGFAILAIALFGCGYPEFTFAPAADAAIPPRDTAVQPDTALPDVVAPETPAGPDVSFEDTFVADTFVADTSVADTNKPDVVEVGVDTGPTCTSNLQCGCGEICSAGKCVASTDCTKDSHFCPAGITCKCVAGKWDIDGTGSTATALVPAQPTSAAENGVDLNLRNYVIHDTAGMLYAMRIRPANCPSAWHYKNVNIQCVDFAGINASGPRGLNISRRTDPVGCRPPSPPELLLDRVNLTTLDSYSVFEDVEYSKITLRKVQTKGSGILIAAWGPGKVDNLIIEDSPNLYVELQGKVTNVSLKASPNFKWWITSPSEVRMSDWPLITITYDKASCPTGRPLTNTGQVKEICLSM